MKSLQGKTALVTGAGRRIGRAVALALAEQGVNVAVHFGQSGAAAAATAQEARRHGVQAWPLQADLADPSDAERLMPRAIEQAGPIDVLVNSASIFGPSSLMDFPLDELASHVQVNALAPLVLARAFARQGRPGDIVNFLDTRVTDYDQEHAAYHLSKRMLFTLTRMMALEFAPRVQVNAIAPGLVLPPPGKTAEHLKARVKDNPLQRHGDVEDVADAVLFLLRSDFVTGQVIFVDGGYHMKGNTYG